MLSTSSRIFGATLGRHAFDSSPRHSARTRLKHRESGFPCGFLLFLLAAIALCGLSGCAFGGSGGGSSNTTPPAPSIASVSPTSGAAGVVVTVTGNNFGATQGTNQVTFNNVAATPTFWSNTTIVAPVPGGASTGSIVVTVNGVASDGVSFAVPPIINGLNVRTQAVNVAISIGGAGFGATQGTSTVSFDGTLATNIVSWSATLIGVSVPVGATTGNVVVTVGGLASNGISFTPGPSVTSLTPKTGLVTTPVTIGGTQFGATQGTSTVSFDGTTATPTSWSDTSIVAPVPSGAATGHVVVTVNSLASNGDTFILGPPPAASCTGTPTGSESLMTGNWAALVQGWQGSGPGSPAAMVFALDSSGAGTLVNLSGGASGDLDEQLGANATNSYQHLTIEQTGSSYSIGPDPAGTGYVGCMTLATDGTNGPGAIYFRFALGGISGGQASKGRIIEWDDTTGTGTRVEGVMLPQTSSQFSLGSLASSYAFGLDGVNPDGSHYATAGSFTLNTSTGAISGETDIDDEGSGCIQSTITGSTGSISSLDGRGTSSLTPACIGSAFPRVFYVVNTNEAFVLQTSAFTSNVPILSGRIMLTGHGSFSSSSFSGNFMIHGSGIGAVSNGHGCVNGITHVNCAGVVLIAVTDTPSGAQTGNASGIEWGYALGSTVQPSTFGTGYTQPAVALTIDPTWGRSVVSGTSIQQPPVFYLATPQSNTEPFLGFGVGSGATSTTLDPTAPLEFIEAGASSNLATSSVAGFRFGGGEDNGDNTVNTNVNVSSIASTGVATGTNYASTPTGLTSSSFSFTWTVTNADPTTPADTFPGILNNGAGSFGITNGTRIIFFGTGSPYGSAGTSAARITVMEQ